MYFCYIIYTKLRNRERRRRNDFMIIIPGGDFLYFPMLMRWLLPVLQPPEMPEEECRQGSDHHTHCPHGLLRPQKKLVLHNVRFTRCKKRHQNIRKFVILS